MAESPAKQETVSVVITAFDVGDYLRQCLDSVIGQTYRDLEIIVIDDGSRDGGGSVCDERAARDGRISVVHTEHRGVASARNLGLEKAAGRYLFFVDGDDWIEPDAVEKLMAALVGRDADLAVAGKTYEYVGRSVSPGRRTAELRTFRGEEILDAYTGGRFGDVVWNKLFRRECLAGIRFPDGRSFEDVAVMPEIMKALAGRGGKAVVLPEELYHYRVRRSGISQSTAPASVADCWRAYRDRLAALPEYRARLLPGCYNAVARIWLDYCGFSKEERAAVKDLVARMQAFSREEFPGILRGDYRRKLKMLCLLSQFKSPAALWAFSAGNRLNRKLRGLKDRMFE